MKKILSVIIVALSISGCVSSIEVDHYDNYGNKIREQCTFYDFIFYSTMKCSNNNPTRYY